ncbi:MAG: replication-associated recombination protein A [Bacteroidia bacterium]|nr:replication-associated recombination protein A [Bacteroidia bacterium]
MTTKQAPLAEILRPQHLEEYIGQQHLVGEGAILRKAIESKVIPSMILWGPPGVGKTTLAMLISEQLHRPFYVLSAISSGVKDVRAVFTKAEENPDAILFIDEIHRFSKSQQDSLLGAVEKGIITLIGATTENPSFEVISPLLSRCQTYILKPLSRAELTQVLNHGVAYLEKTKGITIEVVEDEALMRTSHGDARKMLNALELITSQQTLTEQPLQITNDKVLKTIQQNIALYDKGGEIHYDIISAFIKSVRGSDPNAAIYWLARMVEGGEDPKFIARRLVILAAEDIGNANPNALLLANACFDTLHKIGWPEGRIVLAQTTLYLAGSPKSNSAYLAISNAQETVKKTGDLPVPLHLRNAPTKLMKQQGYGKDYKYAHDYQGNFIPIEFLPDNLRGTVFFEPGSNKREEEMRLRFASLWGDKYSY